jgi:predicted metal-dependent hydrolase
MIVAESGIACVVRRSARARRYRLVVGRDGQVALTIPARGSLARGEAFFRQKIAWVRAAQARLSRRPVWDRPVSRADLLAERPRARALAEGRLKYYQALCVAKLAWRPLWRKLSIRGQKSRWGSCSRAGNLSFNYRLVYLPEALADYVIVHELCHLREMNHGRKFWALVRQLLPDHARRRKELRGGSLV